MKCFFGFEIKFFGMKWLWKLLDILKSVYVVVVYFWFILVWSVFILVIIFLLVYFNWEGKGWGCWFFLSNLFGYLVGYKILV